MFDNSKTHQTKERLKYNPSPDAIPTDKIIDKLAISNNNQMIAAANMEGKIILWNIQTKEKQSYQLNNHQVNQLVFFHHDKILLAASKFKTFLFFIKNKQKNVPFMIINHQWNLFQDTLSQASTHIIQHNLVGFDMNSYKLKLLNLTSNRLFLNQKQTLTVFLTEFSKKSEYMACSLSGGQVVIYQFKNRNILCEWQPHQNCGLFRGVRMLFIDNRNELITSCYEIKIWNFKALISGNKCSLITILCSSNGCYGDMYTDLIQQTLIVRDHQQIINIWNLQSLQKQDNSQLNSISKFNSHLIKIAVAKNFQFLVYCGESNIIRICHLEQYDFNE